MITGELVAHGATLVRYDSPAAFAAGAQANGWKPSCFVPNEPAWQGALRGAREGNTKLVAQAEALVEQLQCSVEAPKASWARSRAGAYPVVPDFLCGHPDSMRRRVEASDDRSPLRVVVDLTSSAGISDADLVKRGTSYMALAMFLTNERPVELEVICGIGGSRAYGAVNAPAAFVGIKIPTQPLDLALACHALTSPTFSRMLGYQVCYAQGSNITGKWPWSIEPFGATKEKFTQRVREALGLSVADVYAPPSFLYDEAIADPIGFVRRAITEHTKEGGLE